LVRGNFPWRTQNFVRPEHKNKKKVMASDKDVEVCKIFTGRAAQEQVLLRFKWTEDVLKGDPGCSVCMEKGQKLLVVEGYSNHCKNLTCQECFAEWSKTCKEEGKKITCPCCRRVATHTREADNILERKKVTQPIIHRRAIPIGTIQFGPISIVIQIGFGDNEEEEEEEEPTQIVISSDEEEEEE